MEVRICRVVIVSGRLRLGGDVLDRFREVGTLRDDHRRAVLINEDIDGHLVRLDLTRLKLVERLFQLIDGRLGLDVLGGEDHTR